MADLKNLNLTGDIASQLATVLRALREVTLLSGQMVQCEFTGAGTDLTVEHGLLRQPDGYIVCSLSASAVIYLSPSSVKSPDREIILRASAAVKASLWIF